MNYQKITYFDTANGFGIRNVLWVSGCEHKCFKCQNPETWDRCSGKLFTQDVLNKLMINLDKPYIDGVTFSGGDPLALYNRATITVICRVLKNQYPDKSIWCYTGYDFEQVKDIDAMKYIDVLVDGKYMDNLRNLMLPYCGSENQRVIDIKKTLETCEICLWDK